MSRLLSLAAIRFRGAPAALCRSTAGWRDDPSRQRPALTATGRPAIAPTLWLAFCVLLVIVASVAYYLLGQYQRLDGTYFLVDDAWIHLRIAQNLADGYGFSFNSGHPIAASTAPLWTVLLALSYRLVGNLVFAAYFWGIVFFAISCLLIYRLVLWISDSFLLAAGAAMVASCCPWLTWSALSGMEILLSATFVLTTLFLHLKYQDSHSWQGFLGVVAAALSTLTRPETYVLFLAIVIHRVARSMLSSRETLRRTLCVWLPMAGLIFALIILPYGLFGIATAGSFFPSTYTAKVGDMGLIGALKGGSVEGIKRAILISPRLYLADFTKALEEISPLLVRVLPVGMLGLLWNDARILPLLLVLFPLVVGAIIPTKRISWPWYRHMLNLIPVFVTVSLAGGHQLLKKVLPPAGKWATVLRAALLGVLTIAMGSYFVSEQPKVRESFVSRGAAMKGEHISVANWINQNLPPQAVIASSDIGVVGFYTQRFIIDTEGLITPEILGQQRSNSPAKDREVYQYLQEAKPDYLVKFYWVYPTFSPAEFTPVHTSGNLSVYRTPWTRY